MDHSTGSTVGPEPSPVLQLHHFAYRCRDAEETRAFYEDLLGLPLVHVIKEDIVPSTREESPFIHLFFALQDGSSIAFFDLGDNIKPEPSPNTPAWVNHLALRVPTLKDVEVMKERLEANGIDVLGVTDHDFVKSIYFFDPNGIRLEFAAEVATKEELDEFARNAHSELAKWTRQKTAVAD